MNIYGFDVKTFESSGVSTSLPPGASTSLTPSDAPAQTTQPRVIPTASTPRLPYMRRCRHDFEFCLVEALFFAITNSVIPQVVPRTRRSSARRPRQHQRTVSPLEIPTTKRKSAHRIDHYYALTSAILKLHIPPSSSTAHQHTTCTSAVSSITLYSNKTDGICQINTPGKDNAKATVLRIGKFSNTTQAFFATS